MGKLLPLPKWTLMTLVENIFKHGNCFIPSNPCVLNLDLTVSDDHKAHFTFFVKNPPDKNPVLLSTSFGIDTVNRILKYHFKDNYRLDIEKNETEFQLKIKIEYEGIIANRTLG